jgi:hypothetical protein
MLAIHKLTLQVKEASAKTKDTTETIQLKNSIIVGEIERLRKQLEEFAGKELDTSKAELGTDERMLLGLIRVIEEQNNQIAATRVQKTKSLRW